MVELFFLLLLFMHFIHNYYLSCGWSHDQHVTGYACWFALYNNFCHTIVILLKMHVILILQIIVREMVKKPYCFSF